MFEEKKIPNENLKNQPELWLDISRYDADSDSAVREVRCSLNDGLVTFEGDEKLIAILKRGIESPSGMIFKPEHGKAFLLEVQRKYKSPYRMASEIREVEE